MIIELLKFLMDTVLVIMMVAVFMIDTILQIISSLSGLHSIFNNEINGVFNGHLVLIMLAVFTNDILLLIISCLFHYHSIINN